MTTKKAKKLSIDERIMLLEDARFFFDDITESDENTNRLAKFKSAAIWTVIEWLGYYQKDILKWKKWNEKTLREWIEIVIRPDYIDKMIKDNKMTKQEIDFYEGWFWLAIWILEWDESQIVWFRKLQSSYEDLEQAKLWNKTIADLINRE